MVLDSAYKQRRIRYCLRQKILPIAVSEAEMWDQPSARDICVAFVVARVPYEAPHETSCDRTPCERSNESAGSINCRLLDEKMRNWSNPITIYEPKIMRHNLCTNVHVTAPTLFGVR